MDSQDEGYLRAAIRLASQARQAGDQPYGALLVAADGTVLAEDRNTVVTGRDITAHPELKLARWAARELSMTAARTTTMYTSCQPCAMCANAIARANLARVVFALAGDQLHNLKPPGSVDPDEMDRLIEAEVKYAEAFGWRNGKLIEGAGPRSNSSTQPHISVRESEVTKTTQALVAGVREVAY